MKQILDHHELREYTNLLLNENVLFELNAIPQMIVNKDRVIIRVNKKFTQLFGYTSEEILGQQTVLLTPSEEKFHEYRKHFVETRDGIIKSEELEYRKKDGIIFWVKLEGNPINQQEKELFILWSFIDVTKEVNYREELKKLASTDPMTSLYNRRFFLSMSREIVSLAKRTQQKISVLMLDIDNFKRINDTYGHDIGDEVIIALSEIMKNSSRASDIICRWGGEEFIILLPNTDISQGYIVGEKIRLSVMDALIKVQDNVEVSFKISIGLSMMQSDEEDVSTVIKRADTALYEAKNSGKNKVVKFLN